MWNPLLFKIRNRYDHVLTDDWLTVITGPCHLQATFSHALDHVLVCGNNRHMLLTVIEHSVVEPAASRNAADDGTFDSDGT